MTRNRKLVLTAITLLVISAVVVPQGRVAAARAIVQCADMVERSLLMKAFPLHQLDPTCPQCH